MVRAAFIVLIAIVAGAGGYASAGSDGGSLSARQLPETASITRGVVRGTGPDSITISTPDGDKTLRFAASLSVETLRPATLNSVRPGDWVNGGAVPHAQTLFALTALVVIPADTVQAPTR